MCAAQPVREVVKPANQLPLNEVELNEEVTNSLTANNPGAPKNIARFNFKERCYKFEPMVDQACPITRQMYLATSCAPFRDPR